MRGQYRRTLLAVFCATAAAPLLFAAGQNQTPRPGSTTTAPAAPAAQAAPFDRHNLDGNWTADNTVKGYRNFASYDQKIPEPELTPWARQHLMMKSISHDALAGKHLPGWDRPGHVCPNNQDPCFSEDQWGIPANEATGEYPAKDCEPLAAPAIYDYPGIGSMELMTTKAGDRIFQMFSYHREWRTFWLNRDHPKPADLDLTFEGHSVARWDGDALVVDTIGFNGKTQISQNISHWKSEDFHLVERFQMTDKDHLVIDMTYADPKAWGDKTWPGFKKFYRRLPVDQFEEFICSPREYKQYDDQITAQFTDKNQKK